MEKNPLNYMKIILILSLTATFWLVACAPTPVPTLPPEPRVVLERLSVEDYPRFEDDGELGPLAQSIQMSLAYLRRLPPQQQIQFGQDAYPVSHLIRSLEVFDALIGDQPLSGLLNQTIRRQFRVYRSTGRASDNSVLFTGYYEPLLSGRLTPDPRHKVPIHSRPRDLVEIDLTPFAADLKGRSIVGQYSPGRVVPYPTRGQIRRSVDFNTVAPPVGWLRDEIDLFILQIQGSGRLQLENGEERYILYAGSNGRPYRSIGSLLIDEGHIPREQMSMDAIRNYLMQNRKVANDILDHNPRYIFFRQAEAGPLGSLGEPLTPMRSAAVDRKIFPSAALAYISTPLPRVRPSGVIEEWAPHTGFVLAQDSGSAIQGPGRIDLFMGHGRQAEVGASHLKHTGDLYFLVLKPEFTP